MLWLGLGFLLVFLLPLRKSPSCENKPGLLPEKLPKHSSCAGPGSAGLPRDRIKADTHSRPSCSSVLVQRQALPQRPLSTAGLLFSPSDF